MNEDSLARNSRGDWSASADCPSCSVVICTRDRPHYLERCLSALASLEYPRFEVLVVDNAPSDGRARETAARWDARYTVEPTPGLSRARNRGLAECKGEIVAYLDDDAVAESGWLSSLVEEFRDPLVMAVAGRIVPVTAPTREALICASIMDRGLSRRSFDRETPGWFVAANFHGIGGGGNMAMRTSALAVWSGFNRRLGRGACVPGGEENYAFFELINAGCRVVYTPAAVVRHPSPQNFSELREQHLQCQATAGLTSRLCLRSGPIIDQLRSGLSSALFVENTTFRPGKAPPPSRRWCRAGANYAPASAVVCFTPARVWHGASREQATHGDNRRAALAQHRASHSARERKLSNPSAGFRYCIPSRCGRQQRAAFFP